MNHEESTVDQAHTRLAMELEALLERSASPNPDEVRPIAVLTAERPASSD